MNANLEILQRLKVAQRRTERAFLRDGPTHDLHPGTEIASAWPFITAGYCGIEQTFKFLIANDKGVSVAQLVDWSPDQGRGFPFRTHDLHELFLKLDYPAREVLEGHYRVFRSLHDYVDVPSLDEFLKTVSDPPGGKAGRGYESWRYSLTDPDASIPQNSPWFLLAVWRAAVEVAEEREHGGAMASPEERIAKSLYRCLERAMLEAFIDRQDRGLPYEDYLEQYRNWESSHGHPLNAYAAVLRDARLGEGPARSGASGTLEEALAKWTQSLHDCEDYDVRRFCERAGGRRGGAGSIGWNPTKRVFEDKPWELEPRWAEAPPSESLQFEGDLDGDQRDKVARLLRNRGFEVLENLNFSDPGRPERAEWLCTLEAKRQAPDQFGDRGYAERVWEPRESLEDGDVFHVEVVAADSREGGHIGRLLRDFDFRSV